MFWIVHAVRFCFVKYIFVIMPKIVQQTQQAIKNATKLVWRK